MYEYSMERVIVDRHDVPSDPDLDGHIKDLYALDAGEIESKEPIQPGDVIVHQGTAWSVMRKIHVDPGTPSARTVLRVKRYAESRLFSHGNRSWWERIPLFPEKRNPGPDPDAN